jgi:hypothetical protein
MPETIEVLEALGIIIGTDMLIVSAFVLLYRKQFPKVVTIERNR